MSDDVDVEELPDLPDLPEIDPQSISVEGDPNEMLYDILSRIEELESALDEIDESHPQTGIVRFELEMLTNARDALEEKLENPEERR